MCDTTSHGEVRSGEAPHDACRTGDKGIEGVPGFSLFGASEGKQKMATKMDDVGIGHCWMAMLKLVSERRRQQCKDSHGTGAS